MAATQRLSCKQDCPSSEADAHLCKTLTWHGLVVCRYVNISPADYNLEETLTSLAYAARVKLITNDAAKNGASSPARRPTLFQPVSECGRFVAEESKEVHRLKDQIKQLKSGAITLEELES